MFTLSRAFLPNNSLSSASLAAPLRRLVVSKRTVNVPITPTGMTDAPRRVATHSFAARAARDNSNQEPPRENMPKPKVLVAVADGSEELEAVTIVDTLVRGGAAVTLASATHNLGVLCSRGVRLSADCAVDACVSTHWDLVVLPGGMPGATHLAASHALRDLLVTHAQRGGRIGAICASPAVVLAPLGLLRDKRATCYPSGAFTAKLPHFVDKPVVVDGSLVTSQGPGTALEFSLTLVEMLFGVDKAQSVREEMLVK